MKLFIIIVLIAASTIDSATIRNGGNKDSKVTLESELLNDNNVVYRSEHEIVKIYIPLFLLQKLERTPHMLFVVEADRSKDGRKIDRGLYVTKSKDDKNKILDNGRDVDGDGLGNVYFAASNGIYIYDAQESRAKKYGSMGEGVISIAAENNTGLIYALTENHILYKIAENGTKVDVDDHIQGAQEIAIDIRDDSLYYYDINKKAHVRTKDGDINSIEGLPENPSYFKMVKTPVLGQGMIFLVNDDAYLAISNGTAFKMNQGETLQFFKPTAYSLEAGVVLYYSHENKIYEYNLIAKILTSVFDQIGKKLKETITNLLNGGLS